MKKRFIPTIIAVVLFLLLFMYANVYESHEIAEPGKDLPVTLANVKLDEVKKVTWKTPGMPDVVVECASGTAERYRLVQPLALRAETSEIDGALRHFEELKSERTIMAAATDTAAFGIGSNSPTLTIETASGTNTFTLGDRNPVGGFYLMRSGDQALYLVTTGADLAFRKGVNDLRARKIFHEEFGDIESVSLESASGTLRMARNASGEWQITEPKAEKADSGEVSMLIFGIRDLRAHRFAQDNVAEADYAKYGLDKPTTKARLTARGGKIYEVLVGRDDGGEVFVKRSDDSSVYVFVKSSLAVLDKDFNQLRTKELVNIPRENIERIKLVVATSTVEIARSDKEWKAKDRVLPDGLVYALIDAVNALRVRSFYAWKDREAHGLARVDGCERVTLKHKGGDTELLLGKVEGEEVYGYLAGREEVFRLPGGVRKALMDLATEADKKPEPPAATGTAPVGAVETPKTASGAVVPGSAPAVPDKK